MIKISPNRQNMARKPSCKEMVRAPLGRLTCAQTTGISQAKVAAVQSNVAMAEKRIVLPAMITG